MPCIFKDLQGHGFLPSTKPMIELPQEFSALNQILDDMTIIQKNGGQGLLAKNQLRKAVDNELPNFME
jgi:indoleamine 2,3-dioxygenase